MPFHIDEALPQPPPPLKLLSLDSGGIRGLASLYILQYLMTMVDPQTPPKPCDYFDMIGGTSTGGLIAIMLGRLRMNVDECIKSYLQLSSTAFQPKRSKMNIAGAVKDKLQARGAYRSEALANEFKKVAKSVEGSEDATLYLSDTTCRVFVCAFRKSLNTAVLFRTYTSDADDFALSGSKIWEAARATSAAATFFDPITIGLHDYVDGATGKNNPVEEVLHEALSIWPDALSRIQCIVSIGTGLHGPRDFGDNLINVLATLKNISTETEATEARFDKLQRLVGLSGKYFRFNVDKGLEAVRLDEHAKIAEIQAAVSAYLKGEKVVDSAKKLAQTSDRRSAAVHDDDEQMVREVEKDKYLAWLPIIDHRRYHNAARRQRIDRNTGRWFLANQFLSWSTTAKSVMWLSSEAGSGKTILASAIIDEIEAHNLGSLAFFYFSFQDNERQNALDFKRGCTY